MTLLVIDTETTSKYPNTAYITQFSAIAIEEDNNISYFNFYINTDEPLTKEVIDITGVNKEMLQALSKGMYFEDYAETWEQILKMPNLKVVAHNLSYDLTVLNNNLALHGFPHLKPVDKYCTMREYTDKCKLPKNKWPKLNEAIDHVYKKGNLTPDKINSIYESTFNQPPKLHDSLYDCYLAYVLYLYRNAV